MSAEGEPVGESGQALERAFPRGLSDLCVTFPKILARDDVRFGR
jgi:hypothetical protein